jgi:hypothetical protein
MPSAAAIISATRNARKFKSGHGGSEEETRPLEDIENPFQMPSVVSKLDKKIGQKCLIKTSVVVMIFIGFIAVMLFCTLVFNNIKELSIRE